ncbi:MAG TPA: hypothetical protein VLM11_00495 [Streptosporangiaceae bacterium]|nr:hypothetical protein [Streptosporangiaceae bacterium]
MKRIVLAFGIVLAGGPWLRCRRAGVFGTSGARLDFLSRSAAFTCLSEAAPVMYQTSSSGRSWSSFGGRLG